MRRGCGVCAPLSQGQGGACLKVKTRKSWLAHSPSAREAVNPSGGLRLQELSLSIGEMSSIMHLGSNEPWNSHGKKRN